MATNTTDTAKALWREFSKGLWTEIPPFRVVLGLCPTLAVTKTAANGLGMGLAVVFVLVLSNVCISAVRKMIPKKVRIVCFIAVSATLVVAVELLMQAFAYPLYEQLGIFVPLIVVNCIILGRAEAFAAKNPVHLSAADGAGMGFGFTLSLVAIGALRETLGYGTLFGRHIFWEGFTPFGIMVEAPGAFIALGTLLALMNWYVLFSGRIKGVNAQPAVHACRGCGACSFGRVR